MLEYPRIALEQRLLNDNHQTAEQPKTWSTMKKCRIFWNVLLNFNYRKIYYCYLKNSPGHSLRILEASWKLPRHFREKSTFHENLDFSVSQKIFAAKQIFLQRIDGHNEYIPG